MQLVKALNHKICGNALTSVRDFCFLDFYLVRTQGLCCTPHLVTTVAYKTFCFLFSSLFESGVGMYVHVAQVRPIQVPQNLAIANSGLQYDNQPTKIIRKLYLFSL